MRKGLILIAILIIGVALFSFLSPMSQKPEEISLSEAIAISQNSECVLDGDTLFITTTEGAELKVVVGNLNLVELQELGFNNKNIKVKPPGFEWSGALISFLPLLLFGGLIFFLFRSARGANSQALRFGRSQARVLPANKPTVTFDDVAGVEEA